MEKKEHLVLKSLKKASSVQSCCSASEWTLSLFDSVQVPSRCVLVRSWNGPYVPEDYLNFDDHRHTVFKHFNLILAISPTTITALSTFPNIIILARTFYCSPKAGEMHRVCLHAHGILGNTAAHIQVTFSPRSILYFSYTNISQGRAALEKEIISLIDFCRLYIFIGFLGGSAGSSVFAEMKQRCGFR